MITLNPGNIDGFLKEVSDFADKKDQEVKKLIFKTCQNIEKEAKKNVPVFEGALRASLRTDLYNDGYTGQVWTNLPYAQAMEFGLKPGVFPPWKEDSPLFKWVRIKLGVTGKSLKSAVFLVAKHIYNYGIKAHPYLFPAYNSEKVKFDDELKNL